MRKNLTEIVFILDRSGSMSGLEADTIGGFNSMIEKQKKADGEAIISTVLFDNTSEVIHDRVNVRDIKPLTDNCSREYLILGYLLQSYLIAWGFPLTGMPLPDYPLSGFPMTVYPMTEKPAADFQRRCTRFWRSGLARHRAAV